jgi:hypothetical protein
MTCTACDQAKVRTCADYRPACMGCRARSIARSRAARDAWHSDGSGETDDLVAAIARMLPMQSAESGWRAVFDWWQRDEGAR